MNYFILDNTTFKIVAKCEDNTSDGAIAASVLASMPNPTACSMVSSLPLPEKWYTDSVPEYIQLTSLNEFVCKDGCYPDIVYVSARLSPESDTHMSCTFHLLKRAHIKVSSIKTGPLTVTDIPKVVVEEIDTQNYLDFSGEVSYYLMGTDKLRCVSITNGSSTKILFSMSEICSSLLNTEIFLGQLFNLVSVLPLPEPNLDRTIYCSVTSDDLLEKINRHAAALKERRIRLVISDNIVMRHRDQVDSGTDPNLTAEQYVELLQYRQALRDLPASADLSNITWPAKPSFI